MVHRVATDQKTSQMNCNISKCCAIIRTFTKIFPNSWLQSLIYNTAQDYRRILHIISYIITLKSCSDLPSVSYFWCHGWCCYSPAGDGFRYLLHDSGGCYWILQSQHRNWFWRHLSLFAGSPLYIFAIEWKFKIIYFISLCQFPA